MPSSETPLLLDTHIWLWVMRERNRLRSHAEARIHEALRRGQLWLSVMSLWEIAMLSSRGRIRFSKPVVTWINESLAPPAPVIKPLTVEIAVASCYLPDAFRSDPADEIIVATARVTGATLMTRDRRILDYAAAGNVTALAA